MKRLRGLEKLAILLGALALAALPLRAQFSSAIEGIVSDPSGAVIPEVELVLTNVDTGVAQTTHTTSAGYYRISALPPGKYKLAAKKEGFQTAIQDNILLEIARIQNVSLTMSVGQVTTQVEVTAAPPMVETTEARVSGRISGGAIQDLPLIGRNVLSSIAQAPGVVGTGLTGFNDFYNTSSFVSITANGQRGSAQLFFVDDAATMDYPSGGGTKLSPNPDSVEEVRVSANNYSAEFGRSSGVLTQVITKSGASDLHGSLFWYHQDNVLTSRTVFQNIPDPTSGRVTPATLRNEFGGSFGGPIRKNKTFFFGTLNRLQSATGVSYLTTVDSPQWVDFMRTNYPNNVSTVMLTSFPADVGYTGRVQTVGNLTGCTGTGPLGMPCDMPILQEGVVSLASKRNAGQWNIRVDHNFREGKDRIYGNVYRTAFTSYGTDPRPAFRIPTPEHTNYGGLSWTHTFSPTVVNLLAGAATSNHADLWDGCHNCRVPSTWVAGLAGFGYGWGPGTFTQNDFHWRDLLTMTRGKHSLKTGFEMYYDQDFAPFSAPINRPDFGFLNVFDFARDTVFTSGNINYDPRTGGRAYQDSYFVSSIYGLFLQDDWKARSNLSINWGLRWDFTSNPSDRGGTMTNIKFNGGNTFQERIAGASVVPLDHMFAIHRIGYFAPRFGFAWDPTGKGKMSIRGGAGIFFDRGGNTVWSDQTRTNPPFRASLRAWGFDPDPSRRPVFGLCQSDVPPFDCPKPAVVVGLNERNGPLAGRAQIGAVDPGLRYPYAQNWFLGVQRAFSNNWVVEADYMGSIAQHLYTAFDRNRFAGDTLDGTLDLLNPYFAGILYGDNKGRSAFQGGTVSIQKRFSAGYNFQAAYTFGKAIDYTSARPAVNKGDVWAGVLDANNYERQRGLSDLNVPHKLSFNFVWNLPKPKTGSRFVNGFIGGWEVSSLAIMQSSGPFTVYTGAADYNADGTYFDVPNIPAYGNNKNGLNRSDYLNGTAFKASDFPTPPPGVEGNLGRNTFTGPGFAQIDFGLIKNTHMPWFVREGANLQVRAEFYNLFNRVNLNGWDTNLANGTFGRSTATFMPRTIQLGLRIRF